MWSIEGEQMPHAITYLGDPRVLPKSSPEMDAVADEFFKKFRDAGLKVGVCIRPSRVIPDGKGGWMHQQTDDPVAEMADKIAYAKKRWGCTIFYMDTNVKWALHDLKDDRTRGMWQGPAELLSSQELYRLTKLHPDVLIFPEFGRFGYWSCCMPYGELRGGNTQTSPTIRAVYPKAGSTITVADGDFMGNYDRLLAGVLGGDIELFRGWFGDPRNQDVKLVYREAGYIRAAAMARIDASLPRALDSNSAVVRYQAMVLAAKGPAGTDKTLLDHASKEADWIVRKKLVEALGELKDPAAVDYLAALMKDRSSKLDHFAAVALGRIGAPAADALMAMTSDADQQTALAALEALAGFDAPKAVPALVKLADGNDLPRKLAAIRALGAQHGDEASATLIALLGDDEKRVDVLSTTCRALGRLGDPKAVKPLVRTIERSTTELKNNHLRVAAGEALEALTGLQNGPYEHRWRKALNDGKIGD